MKIRIVLVVVFLLGLLCGKVMACETYEGCKQEVNNHSYFGQTDDRIAPALQMIAYKLDEISKKLDSKKDIK